MGCHSILKGQSSCQSHHEPAQNVRIQIEKVLPFVQNNPETLVAGYKPGSGRPAAITANIQKPMKMPGRLVDMIEKDGATSGY
jgi:hypothetical protein